LHESPALITFPLIVLAVLAAIGGLISFPTNSWLSGYLAPLFEVATRVIIWNRIHSYGNCCNRWISRNRIAFSKYIKQNQQQMQRSGFAKVLYNKYYVDEAYDTIFVKTTNGLSIFFRDYVDCIIIFSFGFGKVTNEIGYQGKKYKQEVWFYLFVFVLGMCAILFIYSSIILYHERISNINYTFSWRICNLFCW
jgi:NADH-quinone oxidoreductase subunit L